MAKVQLEAEIESELLRQIERAAASVERSVSDWVEAVVRQALQDGSSAEASQASDVANGGIEPIRLRDGTVITNEEEWDALARRYPDIHFPPYGAKPRGSVTPIKLRGSGGTVSDAVIEDRR